MLARSSYVVLCGALLFLLIGCGKKDEDSGGGGGSSDNTEYTLIVRTPGEGSTLRGTFKLDFVMTMDIKDAKGKSLSDAKNQDIKEEISYRETIEAFPDGVKRPTKSRITFDKWEKAKDATGFSKEGVGPKVVGREIIIEKMGGFYDIHAADNGMIDPGLRLFIDKRYQDVFDNFNAQDFLPGKPVRLYSAWDLPIKQMMRTLGGSNAFPLDESKSKGTAKLTKVWEKDGRKYGRIEITTELAVKAPEKDITLKESKLGFTCTLELCIDGSKHDVVATAKMDNSVEFTSSQESGKVKLTGTMTLTEFEEKVGKAANPPVKKNDDTKTNKGEGFPTAGDTKQEAWKDGSPSTKSPPPKSRPKMPVEKMPEDFPKADPPKGFK